MLGRPGESGSFEQFLPRLCSLPVTAQVWTNASGDGLWSTAGNWSTGVVPSSTTNTASYRVQTSDDPRIWNNATTGVTDTGAAVGFPLPAAGENLFIRLEVLLD